MPEESTTPDLVDLTRQLFDASNRGDHDATMRLHAPHAVWKAGGLGATFEGIVAIRNFVEDWIGTYDGFESRLDEVQDLGNGVTFAVTLQRGGMPGSDATVQERWSYTILWEAGLIIQMILRNDIDEVSAAAERLAQKRADG